MNKVFSQSGFRANWLILILPLLFAGCAHVQEKPFEQFSDSVKQLMAGADEALSVIDSGNRDRFIEEAAAASRRDDGAEAVLNLLLDADPGGDPFGWSWASESPPLFMESQRFRQGVNRLNTVLVSYADLLDALASGNLMPPQEFEQLAMTLKTNLNSAATSLGQSPSDKRLSLISAGASAAFQAYLESERREALRRALEENQASIQAIAELMQEALGIAVRNLRQNYEEESMRLAKQLTPDSSADLPSRRAGVTTLISLNNDHIARLSTLRTLNESYAALPGAHRELISAISSPEGSLAKVRLLFANGKQLQRLYKELNEAATGSGE